MSQSLEQPMIYFHAGRIGIAVVGDHTRTDSMWTAKIISAYANENLRHILSQSRTKDGHTDARVSAGQDGDVQPPFSYFTHRIRKFPTQTLCNVLAVRHQQQDSSIRGRRSQDCVQIW